jgi:NAD(P)-dependent dehydrogenase (short-subunit alcohol dehydrogenase family)
MHNNNRIRFLLLRRVFNHGRKNTPMAQQQERPIPPFPPQRQEPPGLEAEMKPLPQYQGKEYKPANKLAGKVALITGGDSGIGRSVAYLFAREGADVAIAYLPAENKDAQVIKEEIEKLGRKCLCLEGDVAQSAFCKEAVDKTVQEFGKLEILVNNVATMSSEDNIETFSDENLERMFRINVFSYYYMAREALRYLKEGSCIINTGSIVGSRGGARPIYSGTKAATHTLTKTLAKELLPRGIRVNCVAPGPVWTPLQAVKDLSEQDIVDFGAHNPIGRPGQPDEMAPAYVYLASEADSSYMTGEIIFVTGGDVAR